MFKMCKEHIYYSNLTFFNMRGFYNFYELISSYKKFKQV